MAAETADQSEISSMLINGPAGQLHQAQQLLVQLLPAKLLPNLQPCTMRSCSPSKMRFASTLVVIPNHIGPCAA